MRQAKGGWRAALYATMVGAIAIAIAAGAMALRAEPRGLAWRALANATYPTSLVRGGATLKDGLYDVAAAPGSASRTIACLAGLAGFGDLDGDGAPMPPSCSSAREAGAAPLWSSVRSTTTAAPRPPSRPRSSAIVCSPRQGRLVSGRRGLGVNSVGVVRPANGGTPYALAIVTNGRSIMVEGIETIEGIARPINAALRGK